MNDREIIASLKAENEQLKKDNEMLKKIVAQMQVTLDRLIVRFVSGNDGMAQLLVKIGMSGPDFIKEGAAGIPFLYYASLAEASASRAFRRWISSFKVCFFLSSSQMVACIQPRVSFNFLISASISMTCCVRAPTSFLC